MNPDDHIVVTGKDGALVTPPAKVDEMVRALVASGKGVVHFHGGLVSEKSGRRVAENLLPVYTEAGAYPIFFIWRSDVRSILRNLPEIAEEEIFGRLRNTLVGHLAGRMRDRRGGKSAGAGPLSPRRVDEELERLQRDDVPFDELVPAGEFAELTREELDEFEFDIVNDEPLLAAVGAAVGAGAGGAKGAHAGDGTQQPTLLDADAIAELRGDAADGAKGIFETAALALKAKRVLRAVAERYRGGRDHGLYATVVEELLREFYLGPTVTAIWTAMKRETLETFEPVANGAQPRGGARFLEALTKAIDGTSLPDITAVGHSTGAVFINNLMATVERERERGAGGGLPAEFRFRRIVFLAPACTFTDFAAVLGRWDHLWERFRMFTMNDAAERRDRLVPVVYPHSLLYFVSGLLERDAEGRSEAGKPVVGLQRWVQGPDSELAELTDVRAFLAAHGDQIVWSPVDGGPGLSAGAEQHGAFDEDRRVQDSLKVFIAER